MTISRAIGDLPDHWQTAPLKRLTSKIGSGATPRGGASTYLPARNEYALVRSQCVHDRHFDLDALSFISPEQARGLRGVELRPGDVLLNITGDGVTFGRCCVVPNEALPAVVNQHVAIIRSHPERLDPGFLMSFLVHPDAKSYIESFNAGGSRRAITKGHIESFEIPLPPISEQRAISGILGALDDKIELNRRMSSTLEEMARALYRSWFVDFGPVHARALGRAPAYMNAETASLFPDSFGPDGRPKGWQSVPLLEFMELISGGTPKTTNPSYWDGGIAWASAKDVSQCDGLFLIETERSITQAGLEKSSTKIVPKYSTAVVARGATTGRACMFGSDIAMNQTCYALKSRQGNPFFANCMFINEVVSITLAAHGSVFDTITTKTLQAAQVVAPPGKLSAAFEEMVSPMFLEVLSRTSESKTLATLRDTLLPRLMSGQLRIREAEKQVEEVV